MALASSAAPSLGDTRTISFYHIHTKETLTILYKKDGRYIPEAMKQIDWIMRDWRKNEAVTIDPKAIDLIWEMHTELGSREPVHIICGYRSRATNEMLRKTRGGQASQSQHITGKAIDVSFPDVPARQMRYSALVRERGGVGYYPTSAIPFVHVDTGRVRHWPRLPRDELALLFPSGRSKHQPADGRPITPADVAAARQRSKAVEREVALYFDVRSRPKTPILVAEAPPPRLPSLPEPQAAPRPAVKAPELRMAVGAPDASPEAAQREAAPQLVAAPRLVERPSQFTPYPTNDDRWRLDMLVTLASLEGPEAEAPQTLAVAAAPPTPRQEAAPKAPVLAGALPSPLSLLRASAPKDETKVAALAPLAPPPRPAAMDEAPAGWVTAPAYDDEHPEELSYRPFPLAPLLTASASPDDPVLATMVHPDIAETLEVLDDSGSILPMRLRPGRQTAGLLWAQAFRGEAVSVADLGTAEPSGRVQPGLLANRSVRTTAR